MAAVTCLTSGFHDLNIWFEVKGREPGANEIWRAAMMVEKSRSPLMIGIEAPYLGSRYLAFDEEGFYEEYTSPFLDTPGVYAGYDAARSYQFWTPPEDPMLFVA
jgi:hypothetical protein